MSRTATAERSLRPQSDSRFSCISCCKQYFMLDNGLSYLTACAPISTTHVSVVSGYFSRFTYILYILNYFVTSFLIQGGHKVGEKHSLSFPDFSRAINLLFHRLSQQKVNVIMTFIKGSNDPVYLVNSCFTQIFE